MWGLDHFHDEYEVARLKQFHDEYEVAGQKGRTFSGDACIGCSCDKHVACLAMASHVCVCVRAMIAMKPEGQWPCVLLPMRGLASAAHVCLCVEGREATKLSYVL